MIRINQWVMRDYRLELCNVLRARRLCYQTIETYKNELRKFLGFCYSESAIKESVDIIDSMISKSMNSNLQDNSAHGQNLLSYV